MSQPPTRERKVITVLFADLVGFTAQSESLDPEDVEAILRPYHERLRSELERHGGTVEKFIGDAVMALFGAPTAHEDDPERAVRPALAIREGAREEGELELRIGITTGEALVSLDVRPEAGEGMADGDVVNTAGVQTLWHEGARRIASGDLVGAAEVYAEITSVPDEAYARLRAAEQLVGSGRRAEADAQLRLAMPVFAQLGATGWRAQAESLLAASA